LDFGLLRYLEINPNSIHTISLKAKKHLFGWLLFIP
jgi:hypothetical protein